MVSAQADSMLERFQKDIIFSFTHVNSNFAYLLCSLMHDQNQLERRPHFVDSYQIIGALWPWKGMF